MGVVREACVYLGRHAARNYGENIFAPRNAQPAKSQVGHRLIARPHAQFLARAQQFPIQDGLILRHLGRVGNVRGVSGSVPRLETLHGFDVARVDDDHTVLT